MRGCWIGKPWVLGFLKEPNSRNNVGFRRGMWWHRLCEEPAAQNDMNGGQKTICLREMVLVGEKGEVVRAADSSGPSQGQGFARQSGEVLTSPWLLNTGRVLADVPRQKGKSLPSLAPRNHFRMQTVEGLGLLSVQQFSCGAGGRKLSRVE